MISRHQLRRARGFPPVLWPTDPARYGLTVEVVHVTPELAARWLERNHRHRKIDPRRVRRYAKQMTAGTWSLNGKTLVFDAEGMLLGGQHRLTACVESGVGFTTLVVRGINPEAVLGSRSRGENGEAA